MNSPESHRDTEKYEFRILSLMEYLRPDNGHVKELFSVPLCLCGELPFVCETTL
jgi:hypothetical protein